MFNRLLVPLDGSKMAERALEPAFSIASPGSSQVILLRVPVYRQSMSPSAAGYSWLTPDLETDSGLNAAGEYIENIAADYFRLGFDILPLISPGDAAGTIVDTASDHQVDLIVLTTHGYSGFTRWMLGSVTERVLRAAPCPVLVIRHQQSIKKMVICLDGSKLAEEALEPAFDLAARTADAVTLLRVDHQESMSEIERGLLEMTDSELCKELDQQPEKRLGYYLDCIRSSFEQRGPPIETAVVRGEPAQAILDYAGDQTVDLIAMATHGYSGLRRWVYGSVTEKVLRKAPCAMLVVRPAAELLK